MTLSFNSSKENKESVANLVAGVTVEFIKTSEIEEINEHFNDVRTVKRVDNKTIFFTDGTSRSRKGLLLEMSVGLARI